jgi:hypothetical protein
MKTMRNLLILLAVTSSHLLRPLPACGQGFVLHRYAPNISFVVMDSIHGAQSTVIEYPEHLVLIEVPVLDEGGGKQANLDEDTLRAAQFRDFLGREFGNRPVRYILSSHWHQHSLSGVTPFTSRGARIVATHSNWNYAVANGLVAPDKLDHVTPNIILVSKDTLLLADSPAPIQVVYLDTSYTHKPTEDYLFFHLPKQRALHVSCMAAVSLEDLRAEGSPIYSSRLIDVEKAIAARNLKIDKLIGLGRERFTNGDFTPGVYDLADVMRYMRNGRSPDMVLDAFRKLDITEMRLRPDSVIAAFIEAGVGPGLVNSLVYECIGSRDPEKAVAFAQLLNLYHPGVPDFIDSLGESYYFNGDLKSATRINTVLFMIDPQYNAGLKAWEENMRNLK